MDEKAKSELSTAVQAAPENVKSQKGSKRKAGDTTAGSQAPGLVAPVVSVPSQPMPGPAGGQLSALNAALLQAEAQLADAQARQVSLKREVSDLIVSANDEMKEMKKRIDSAQEIIRQLKAKLQGIDKETASVEILSIMDTDLGEPSASPSRMYRFSGVLKNWDGSPASTAAYTVFGHKNKILFKGHADWHGLVSFTLPQPSASLAMDEQPDHRQTVEGDLEPLQTPDAVMA